MAREIITYETFDLFHIEHSKSLQRLKSLSDKLIVVESTDEYNGLKKGKTMLPYTQSTKIDENIKCVDIVSPKNKWKGKFYFLNEHCEVVYHEHPKDISTTQYTFKIIKTLKKDFT